MSLDPSSPLVMRYDVAALEAHGSPLVAIDSRGVITWANAAWIAHSASGNCGPRLMGAGASYFEAVHDGCREAYKSALARCLGTIEPIEHDHICPASGAPLPYRVRMLRLDLADVLIAHSHANRHPLHDERTYRDCNDFVVMCSNCRHVRRGDTTAWDWVPDWLTTPPERLSHGICPVCHGFYWGDLI